MFLLLPPFLLRKSFNLHVPTIFNDTRTQPQLYFSKDWNDLLIFPVPSQWPFPPTCLFPPDCLPVLPYPTWLESRQPGLPLLDPFHPFCTHSSTPDGSPVRCQPPFPPCFLFHEPPTSLPTSSLVPPTATPAPPQASWYPLVSNVLPFEANHPFPYQYLLAKLLQNPLLLYFPNSDFAFTFYSTISNIHLQTPLSYLFSFRLASFFPSYSPFS